MVTPDYKYTINALILAQPREKSITWMTKQLAKEGIAERTFFRDKAITKSEADDIPGERLHVYAKFFGVTVDELFNYSKKIKPASERKVKAA